MAPRPLAPGQRGALGLVLCALLPGILPVSPAFSGIEAAGGELAAPAWVAVRYLREQDRVALRWSPVPGADFYRLWSQGMASAPLQVRATITGVQHFEAAPDPGATVTYRVQAVRGGSAGPLSEERAVTVPAPPPVREAVATNWLRTQVQYRPVRGGPPQFRVELRWQAIPGAVGYRLFRREAGSPDFAELGLYTETSVFDAAVAEGRTYEYAVTTLGEALDESPLSMVRSIPVSAAGADIRLPPLPASPAFSAVRVWDVQNSIGRAAAPRRAPLDDPYDVAYDPARDRLYVSSTTTGQIVVLRGEDGAQVAIYGPSFGATRLVRPLGLALDRSGNLVVVDDAQGALVVISPAGELRRRIVLAGKGLPRAPRPVDVAVHPDKRIFVADSANRQVVVLSPDGKQLSRWGAPKAAEPLLGVGALEISREGNVIVADAAATRVRVFTPAGRAIASYCSRGREEGEIYSLGGFTALPDGTILASDLWSSTITAYGPASGALSLVNDQADVPAIPLLGPLNLTTDGGKRIFLVEAIANRITCLRLVAAQKAAAESPP